MPYLLALIFLVPAPAFAHELSHDDNVGAVMHVDPNDSPVIGRPATFYFNVTDKTGAFSYDACDCSLEISQGGEDVATVPLDPTTHTASYTFTAAGEYGAALHADPKPGAGFAEFELGYRVEVLPVRSRRYVAWAAVGAAALAVGALGAWMLRRRAVEK